MGTVRSGIVPSLPTALVQYFAALAASPLLCCGNCDCRDGGDMGAPSSPRAVQGGVGSAAAVAAPWPRLTLPGAGAVVVVSAWLLWLLVAGWWWL